MPSSRNTIHILTGDQISAVLDRKLKQAAKNTAERKLATGEYVMYEGRVVPASMLAEAQTRQKRR